MIPIDCPVCGRRESSEFQYWGEAGERTVDDDGDIRAVRREHYLRVNDPGWMLERWMHVAGCGRFLRVERHRNLTGEGLATNVSRSGDRSYRNRRPR